MRVLYASDTHVHPGHLDRLLRAASEAPRPDVVIVGGDIIPAWHGGIRESLESHRDWVRGTLLPRLARFRLEAPGLPVLLDFGNDDIAAARPMLEARDGLDLILMDMRVVRLADGMALAGYMAVSPTPFGIKDREKPDCLDRDGLSDPGVRLDGMVTTPDGRVERRRLDLSIGTMENDLEALSDKVEKELAPGERFLFVSHCPPRDSALDLTGHGLHVGSLAVRRFIERLGAEGRLIASLHGHIHESPAMSGKSFDVIAGVPCFNAGQERLVLKALRFDTEDPLGTARLLSVTVDGGIAARPLEG